MIWYHKKIIFLWCLNKQLLIWDSLKSSKVYRAVVIFSSWMIKLIHVQKHRVSSLKSQCYWRHYLLLVIVPFLLKISRSRTWVLFSSPPDSSFIFFHLDFALQFCCFLLFFFHFLFHFLVSFNLTSFLICSFTPILPLLYVTEFQFWAYASLSKLWLYIFIHIMLIIN